MTRRTLLQQRTRPQPDTPLPNDIELPALADYGEARRWADTELSSLVATVRTAAEIGEIDTAATIPFALLSNLNLRKPWPQWIEMHEVALEAAPGRRGTVAHGPSARRARHRRPQDRPGR